MSDKTVELKSCPFCGGKLKTINNIYGKCTNKKCFLGGTKTMEQSHDNTVDRNEAAKTAQGCIDYWKNGCGIIEELNRHNFCHVNHDSSLADCALACVAILNEIKLEREAVIKEVEEFIGKNITNDLNRFGLIINADSLLSKLSKMREGE